MDERGSIFCNPSVFVGVLAPVRLNPAVRGQRLRQTEHATSHGNALQVAGHAAPILGSKNSRSGDLREVGHAKASMLCSQELREITEVFDQFAKTSKPGTC
jgi:hypothetical protein